MVLFADRVDAGRRLAERLGPLRATDVVVLGLPRGGVPVAAEVARALGAPLDVLVVRKLGVPGRPELAMGAIAEGGVRVVDERMAASAGVTEGALARVEERERAELDRRVAALRRGRAPVDLTGRTAVVVDDGVATGSTARAACRVARLLGARRVVLAVPVGPPEVVGAVPEADEVVCARTPSPFLAVGHHYRDFRPTSDDDVAAILHGSGHEVASDVGVPVDGRVLAGRLVVPAGALGVVVFAHGSGSGWLSPRNRTVAAALADAGLGTLLVDLLDRDEAIDSSRGVDVELLAARLSAVSAWLLARPDVRAGLDGGPLPLGWFGASTGAAAALWAAAEPGSPVRAIASRGGRPDLATVRLGEVRAPTLLVVGGRDEHVLELNSRAQSRLRCPNRLEVVAGATHLFEEPGALEEVARLSVDWFTRHLPT